MDGRTDGCFLHPLALPLVDSAAAVFLPRKVQIHVQLLFSFLHCGCPNTGGTARVIMVTLASSSSSSSSSSRRHSVGGSNAKTRILQSSRPIDEDCPAEAADKNAVAWHLGLHVPIL